MTNAERYGDIIVRDLGADGATVEFPKKPEWLVDFKATFPKARWALQTKVWSIPGKRACNRARKWAEKIAASDNPADRQKAMDAAMFDGRTSPFILLGASSCKVVTPYDPGIVAICRRLGGQYANKAWTIPGAQLAALIEATPEIDSLARQAQQKEAEEKAARDRARAAERAVWAAERAAKDAHMAHVRSHRHVVLASQAPTVGQTVRFFGAAVVVESLGRQFRADENTSSIGGPIGAEGELVRYAYYRAATPTEEASLVADEQKLAAAAAKRRAQKEAIARVASASDAPDIGHVPDGEEIWRDDRSAPVGYRTWIVLTPDGWLWHLTYDGTDGGMWGTYNCGYNTRGVRIEAEPELIATIKGVAL